MAEDQGCQFREQCPVSVDFPEDRRQLYVALYCTRHVELCVRRQLRLQGEPVPPHMAPNGLIFVDLPAYR